MAAFRTGLPAEEVDRQLRAALEELRRAEKSAVLWFAEVFERKLYRELGYSSIHLYAGEALGFGPSKTSQFLRLCEAMKTLPAVKASVASGDLSWTKARELVKVATPRTEARWIERAKTSSRRELEREVAVVKARARARRREKGQGSLLEIGGGSAESKGSSAGEANEVGSGNGNGNGNLEVEMAKEMPVEVTLRLSPEQYAKFEAMLEAFRKQGGKGTREDVVMAGVEAVVKIQVEGRRGGSGRSPRNGDAAHPSLGATGVQEARVRVNASPPERVCASPYQVVVHVCERCERGEVLTSRGLKGVEPGTLSRILCDARVHRRGGRNRSTVPPSVRLEVLARDRYRCQWRGCGSVQFVNVHHLVPREAGGSNHEDNLITLCGGCHRVLHKMAEKGWKPEGAKGRLVVSDPRSLRSWAD